MFENNFFLGVTHDYLDRWANSVPFPYYFCEMEDKDIVLVWITHLTKFPNSNTTFQFLARLRDSNKKYLLEKCKDIENNIEKHRSLI